MMTLTPPPGGWLRAVRRGMGLSLKTVAGPLGVTPQAVHQLEKSEASTSASLRQLDAAAAAMGCRLVYAIVPLQETLAEWVHTAGDEAAGSEPQ